MSGCAAALSWASVLVAALAWPLAPAVANAGVAEPSGGGRPLAAESGPAPLPRLKLQPDGLTVSGLSSGGYMAVQFHIAHAARVRGVAAVASGPYGCSRGSAVTALLECACPVAPDAGSTGASWQLHWQNWWRLGCRVPSPAELATRADGLLERNRDGLDDPAHLAGQRVWLMAGVDDPVVRPDLVIAQADFYRRHGVAEADLRVRKVPGAAHGLPVPDGPVACARTAPPFLTDCGDLDAAGELLSWLYAPAGQPALQAPAPLATASALRRFDQRPYRVPGRFDGLDDTGYVFVPQACAEGAACRLHVVFHGCGQGAGFPGADGRPNGARFAAEAGYNRWAQANRIVVLYPQVRATRRLVHGEGYNPQGCWDFWGYTHPTGAVDAVLGSYARREAPQMAAVARMVRELAGEAADGD